MTSAVSLGKCTSEWVDINCSQIYVPFSWGAGTCRRHAQVFCIILYDPGVIVAETSFSALRMAAFVVDVCERNVIVDVPRTMVVKFMVL